MFRLLSKRPVYWCSAFLSTFVLSILVFAQANETAGNVTGLFQEAQTVAAQLKRDAATMESFTRAKVTWQSHSDQIAQIKEHVNKAGSILSQMHDARQDAHAWHQDAIDGITPVLKQLASNTEAIINRLNDNPKQITDPAHVEYIKSNMELASELSAAVGNIVDYDNTKTRMEELEAKLGKPEN